MVSSTTAVGGTLRCVTLACKDTLALERWMSFLEKVGARQRGKWCRLRAPTASLWRGKCIVRQAVRIYSGLCSATAPG